jgi:hypothetical protein
VSVRGNLSRGEDLLNAGQPDVSAAFRQSVVDAICDEASVSSVILDARIASVFEASGASTTCVEVSSATQRPH